jgi:hypothetical protein
LLGAASLAFGLFAIAVMVYIVLTQDAADILGMMIAGCALYVGVGVFWMLAGWHYWRKRYRKAILATVLGILIPVALFSILGF